MTEEIKDTTPQWILDFKAAEEAGEFEYKEPTEHQLKQWWFPPGKPVKAPRTEGDDNVPAKDKNA